MYRVRLLSATAKGRSHLRKRDNVEVGSNLTALFQCITKNCDWKINTFTFPWYLKCIMDPKKIEGVPKWREGGMWKQFPHNPVFLKWERPLMLSLNCYECHQIFSALNDSHAIFHNCFIFHWFQTFWNWLELFVCSEFNFSLKSWELNVEGGWWPNQNLIHKCLDSGHF